MEVSPAFSASSSWPLSSSRNIWIRWNWWSKGMLQLQVFQHRRWRTRRVGWTTAEEEGEEGWQSWNRYRAACAETRYEGPRRDARDQANHLESRSKPSISNDVMMTISTSHFDNIYNKLHMVLPCLCYFITLNICINKAPALGLQLYTNWIHCWRVHLALLLRYTRALISLGSHLPPQNVRWRLWLWLWLWRLLRLRVL